MHADFAPARQARSALVPGWALPPLDGSSARGVRCEQGFQAFAGYVMGAVGVRAAPRAGTALCQGG